jgi:hypothetical protein
MVVGVMVAAFLKCLTGYEYMTAVVGSAVAAVVVVSDDEVCLKDIAKSSIAVFTAIGVGFAFALFLHMLHLKAFPGGSQGFGVSLSENMLGGDAYSQTVASLRPRVLAICPAVMKDHISDSLVSALVVGSAFCRYFTLPVWIPPFAEVSGPLNRVVFPMVPLLVPVVWVLLRGVNVIRRRPGRLSGYDRLAVAALVSLVGCVLWQVLVWDHMVRHVPLNSILFLIGFVPLSCLLITADLVGMGSKWLKHK